MQTGKELTVEDVYVNAGIHSRNDFDKLADQLSRYHGLVATVQDDGPVGYALAIHKDGSYTVVGNLDVATWRGWMYLSMERYFNDVDWAAEFKTNLLSSETDIELIALAVAKGFKAMYQDLNGEDSI